MESATPPSPFKADILKGKVALVTGGGSGIGFELVTEFGKHGAFVAIMGRRKPVLDAAVSSLRSQGIQAIGLEGDVRKRDDAIRVLESTVKQFGRLDILVNAAAGNFLVPAEDLSPNGFKTGVMFRMKIILSNFITSALGSATLKCPLKLMEDD
ncbi:Peroxisomal 2,4-dienoyl-CoA reductase [Thalictrum thalictroides]|uniref:2,4-dienoyl-CoA reductase [(3E)-enoyl-CoA-producing] n=1 Tax=Thalictrum thalictroides TaxID=46969 RepID=A0A7J6X3Y1_THATH|nr:Peroxisomal 2,4-dienoyl-CoA reductase [Thalictrum thalictroides]